MKSNFNLVSMLSLGIILFPAASKAVTHTFTSNTTISASQVNQNFSELEASIAALNSGSIPEGTNLYFTEPRVLATTLTGYTTGSPAPLSASDTFLQAIGKLEALITNLQASTLQASGGTMYGPLDMMGNSLTNLATPVLPTDAATKQYVDSNNQFWGLVTSWSAPGTVDCYMGGSTPFSFSLSTERNDLGFNTGTNTFTIPGDGLYEIFLDLSYSAASPVILEAKLTITNGGSTFYSGLQVGGQSVRRFLAGDQIQLVLACGHTTNTTTMTIDSGRFLFAVKKLAY